MAPAPAQKSFPAPDDPTPRYQIIRLRLLDGSTVPVKDDAYSDRLRCDHPTTRSGQQLVDELISIARQRGRGRIMVLARSLLRPQLLAAGMQHEATMPGFYQGMDDCDALGLALDPQRAALAEPDKVAEVDALIGRGTGSEAKRERPQPATERATAADAEGIAELVTATFEHYPTPTGVPDFVAEQIEQGVPFRIIREGGRIVSCASADLVPAARTAELTDCATEPAQRGRGHMQAILTALMDDLRAMDYPTAFTLARASVPGVNLAFQRLGFRFAGRMTSSCRIGGGIEDMNVWSRSL